MSRPKIVIIDSADIAVAYTAEAVKALGFEPVFLVTLAAFQGDPRKQLSRYPHIPCDTSSVDAVVAAVQERCTAPLAGLLTTLDTRLTVACAAAAKLGLPGIDPAVLRLKDKAAVAQLIPEFSPTSLEFTPDRIPFAALHALLASAGSVIVKPTHGTGALGLIELQCPHDVDSLVQRLAATALPSSMDQGRWIAQPFVRGRLVSAEGYVIDGLPTLIGFTGRRKVGATESAATFPVDATLTLASRERALSAIAALVARSGYRRGYFHMEFIVNAEDCLVIDANMGRLGGGPIGQLLAVAANKSPVQVYSHVIAVTLGLPSRHQSIYPNEGMLEAHAVLYGLQDGGIVDKVCLPDRMPCYHTQILDSGTYVHPMGRDDWSWVGILAGTTQDTLRTIREITISTTEGQVPAYF